MPLMLRQKSVRADLAWNAYVWGMEIRILPPFSLIRDFGKQNTSDFGQPRVLSTDRIEIHQLPPLV